MLYQSESGERHHTKSKSPPCLTCVTLEMEFFGSRFIFLTLPLRLSRGKCHGNIYTPETEQMRLFLWLLFTSPAQRLLVLEVLEMKGKTRWERFGRGCIFSHEGRCASRPHRKTHEDKCLFSAPAASDISTVIQHRAIWKEREKQRCVISIFCVRMK